VWKDCVGVCTTVSAARRMAPWPQAGAGLNDCYLRPVIAAILTVTPLQRLRTPNQHSAARRMAPGLKPSAQHDLQVAGLQYQATTPCDDYLRKLHLEESESVNVFYLKERFI
jgi:hypothetical protein